jgi:hypothetical protein
MLVKNAVFVKKVLKNFAEMLKNLSPMVHTGVDMLQQYNNLQISFSIYLKDSILQKVLLYSVLELPLFIQ